MKTDAAKLLRELKMGISMWGVTSLMAFLVSFVSFVLGYTILTYAYAYENLPQVLDFLYASYALTISSLIIGIILLWKYFALRRRYTRLFDISRNLR